MVKGLDLLSGKRSVENLKLIDRSLEIISGPRRPSPHDHVLSRADLGTGGWPIIHQLTIGVLLEPVAIVGHHLMYPLASGEMILYVGQFA